MIRFGREVCGNLEVALEREWLETNGLGGFASSSIAGVNTRRYHGLLMAAIKPPAGRMLLLSKVEETLFLGDRAYELSANRYPGVVHPQGYCFLEEFRLDPFPTWTYAVEDVELEKRVFLVHGRNTVVIEYTFRAGDFQPRTSRRLVLKPLVAFRDYHATAHQNNALNPALTREGAVASLEPYPDCPRLYFDFGAADLENEGVWYRDFEYDRERERGLDFREDLFCPFSLSYNLESHPSIALTASTDPPQTSHGRFVAEAELKRRADLQQAAPSAHPLVQKLTTAADHFVVDRGGRKSIIAGYHWFADWGRDTMIALPGLTLATGRPDIARSVLETFVSHLDRGMLPNRFPDAGEEPEYNTVDATLWLFEAVRSYAAYSGDFAFIREKLYEKLKEAIDCHLSGTRYGICVDRDGLLSAGEPGVQLTWMDARVGGRVITPRYGKPVEIQALWYNALRTLQDLAGYFNDSSVELFLGELSELARTNFEPLFWNGAAECLYDVVNGQEKDESIRPNQILAVSLHYGMLAPTKARSVVQVVERELLTPMGLRSLSPGDPQYCPRYEGDGASRDSAYHQGTVWPWLLGPFVTAYVKTRGRTPESREQARRWIEGFEQHLETAGLGQISEVADAEAPFAPKGCIAQAWSVAELLRAAVEDVYCSELSHASAMERNKLLCSPHLAA
jgi:predicted glycogen debranching enzyme